MTTMQDIVTGAARRIRIIGAGESLSAEDSSDILAALNTLMAQWQAEGIDIGWTTSLAASATFPLEAKHEDGVKALLAKRVAEDFGEPVSNALAVAAIAGWQLLWADYHVPDSMRVDDALRYMPSRRRAV